MAAKLATYALVGAGYGALCLGVVTAIALPWLAAEGIELGLMANGLPGTYAGVIADTAIFGLPGVGLGALLRNQVATVVGLLVYRFVAEPILVGSPALGDWTTYLPGSASAALTQVSLTTQDYLAAWQGGLVLAGYGLLLAATGTSFSVRRDIT